MLRNKSWIRIRSLVYSLLSLKIVLQYRQIHRQISSWKSYSNNVKYFSWNVKICIVSTSGTNMIGFRRKFGWSLQLIYEQQVGSGSLKISGFHIQIFHIWNFPAPIQRIRTVKRFNFDTLYRKTVILYNMFSCRNSLSNFLDACIKSAPTGTRWFILQFFNTVWARKNSIFRRFQILYI